MQKVIIVDDDVWNAERLRKRFINLDLTYERNTLPDFVIWKMLGESEYVIGLEPRTTEYGGQDISDHDVYVKLEPFQEYRTKLEFSVREQKGELYEKLKY